MRTLYYLFVHRKRARTKSGRRRRNSFSHNPFVSRSRSEWNNEAHFLSLALFFFFQHFIQFHIRPFPLLPPTPRTLRNGLMPRLHTDYSSRKIQFTLDKCI